MMLRINLGILLLVCSAMANALDKITVTINQHKFYLEKAQTLEEYRLGLMYRQQLPASHGMIFLFQPSAIPPQMWMKNTYIPLDLLFIAADSRIKCIIEHTTPLSLELLSCGKEIAAVIELNAGEVKKYHLNPGMKIQ